MASDLSPQRPSEDAHEQKTPSSVNGKDMAGKFTGWILALMVAIIALFVGFSFKSRYSISSFPSLQQVISFFLTMPDTNRMLVDYASILVSNGV